MQQPPFDLPFVLSDVLTAGLSRAHVRTWLERGLVRRIAQGVFVRAEVSTATECLSTSMFNGSRIASFAASAQLQGIWTPTRLHPTHTAALRADSSHGEHMAKLGSLQVCDLALTALNLARYQSFPQALIPLDSALRLGVSKTQLSALFPALPYRRGTGPIAAAIDAADGRSESPLESVGRGQMLCAGIATPVLQLEIRVDNARYRADFAWPEARVVVEADGEGKYSDPDEEKRERWRRNQLIRAGWQISRYGWSSISGERPEFIQSLRRLLQR